MKDFTPFFELGGITIPVEANLEFDQSYESLAAETWPPIRMMNGTGVKQVAWNGKIRTTLTGSGNALAALDGLDYSQSMLLKCAKPRGISSAANSMTITANRRSDAGFEPYGYAVVGGRRVNSPVAMVGDIATVTLVAGASGYGVYYFPQITVFAQAPITSGNLWDTDFSWSLEAEEV